MKKAVRDKNKAGLFRRRRYKPLFIETYRTARGVFVVYPYSRVPRTIGSGFSGGRPFFTFSEKFA